MCFLVFDRGIVSEENLAAIRKRDGLYLTGTPRSRMKQKVWRNHPQGAVERPQ
jgi:hypothetical protein